MKKLFVCLVAVAMAVTVNAQEKAMWGVRAGMNVTNMSAKLGAKSESFDSRVGFNVGVSYQQPLVSKLYLETGLNLTSRGANVPSGLLIDEMFGKLKINTLYLQLPVALSWHFDFDKISLQPYVGVYYGLGLSGTLKPSEGEGEIKLFKKETQDGDEMPQTLKRSDFGMRFGLGVALNSHYYLGLGYDMGMTNILKKGNAFFSDDVKGKNGSFYISLGYNF